MNKVYTKYENIQGVEDLKILRKLTTPNIFFEFFDFCKYLFFDLFWTFLESLGTFWEHFRTFLEHFGNMFWNCSGSFGNMFGTFWEHFWRKMRIFFSN